MQDKKIREAYQKIAPSQADKERMLQNILEAAPKDKAARRERPVYRKRYEEPKPMSVILPIAAALAAVILAGAALGWLSASRREDISFTAPPETVTIPAETESTSAEEDTTPGEEDGVSEEALKQYAQAIFECPELSYEFLRPPESTSTHHVYTFYDWNQDGQEELLIGLWNGNYAYRGTHENITHEIRLENVQAVVYPFTGNEHMAYLCEGGVIEDTSVQGYQILPVGEGTPVLVIFYDESLDSWYKMSDDPNSPYDIPIEEAEKDALLAAYPHLELNWKHILDFPGLQELAEQMNAPTFKSDEAGGSYAEKLAALEEQASVLNDKLFNDGSLNQADMNELSGQIYTLWDDALNELWADLGATLDKETMQALLEEQREWIKTKEAALQEIRDTYAGGSITGLVVNNKASELTRERVYALVERYFS